MEIPKIIHYCWFGRNPLPQDVQKCITSWREYFPNYEIKEWNENNFDVNIIKYTKEAYQKRKYAFVSDYARFWILYHYGGIYFDTDVEVIKPFDDILANGPYLGLEGNVYETSSNIWDVKNDFACNPGLGMAAYARMDFFKLMLDFYSKQKFILRYGAINSKTVVRYTTEMLINSGIVIKPGIMEYEGILIYPKDYFCPTIDQHHSVKVTENTHSIHHYTATWTSKEKLVSRHYISKIVVRVFPPKVVILIRKMWRLIIGDAFSN